MAGVSPSAKTFKQGQYLAYIYLYTRLHRRPPAEAEQHHGVRDLGDVRAVAIEIDLEGLPAVRGVLLEHRGRAPPEDGKDCVLGAMAVLVVLAGVVDVEGQPRDMVLLVVAMDH